MRAGNIEPPGGLKVVKDGVYMMKERMEDRSEYTYEGAAQIAK